MPPRVAASRARVDYIPFQQAPLLPKDLRPASDFKAQVGDMIGRRRTLERQAASLPASQTDTEAFARANSEKLLKLGLTPPAADQSDQTDAYVAKLRALAAPPRDKDAPPASPNRSTPIPALAPAPPT